MKPQTMELPFRRFNILGKVLKLSLFSALVLLLTLIPLYEHPLLHHYQYVVPPPLSNLSQHSSASNGTETTRDRHIFTVDTAPPPPPPPPPRPPPLSPPPPTPSTTNLGLARECDISRGEWVRDAEAPYYTNTTCWTIQEHQNCMKYGRPDMDFLKWRWKPEGCELPRFDPVRFLELVRNKSMAFVGDSLARNHVQSLMCLLSTVAYPKEIHTSDETFKRMLYTTYNFTISIFWSPFLIKAEEVTESLDSTPSSIWKLHLDKVDKIWASRIHRNDYVIISTGNWFTRRSKYYKKGQLIGCQYCTLDNVPYMALYNPHRMAFRTALRAINRVSGYKGMTVLRTISPDHFENGTWDKGGDCARTRPFRSSSEARFKGMDLKLYKAQLEEFRKAEEAGRKKGLRFSVLDTTGAMLLRPDGHPSHYGHWPHEKPVMYNDCVHWCLPGPVDAWNDFLLFEMSRVYNGNGTYKSPATPPQ